MSANLHDFTWLAGIVRSTCASNILTNLAVPATELAKFAMEPGSKRRKLAVEAQEAAGLPVSTSEESVNTLQLNVSLPSGRCALLSLPLDGTVLDLKMAAQQSLGQAFLRLAAPDGRLLKPQKTLQDSGLQSGDNVTAVAQKLKAAATETAMALWCFHKSKCFSKWCHVCEEQTSSS
eukprot:s2930_g9.t1